MSQATAKSPSSGSNSLLIKWLVCFCILALVYFILPIDGNKMTHEMGMFLVITVFMVTIWAFGLVNEIATGIVLPVLYVALCHVPAKVIYAGWLTDVQILLSAVLSFVKFCRHQGLENVLA